MSHARMSLSGLLLALSACTRTIVLAPTSPPEDFARASRLVAARPAEVSVQDGHLFRLRSIRLTRDSLAGIVPAGTGAQLLPLATVLEINGDKNRTGGALRGALVGAGIGGLLGAASPVDGEYCYGCSRGEYALQMAVGGAIWGAVIGAVRGDRLKVLIGR